MSKSSSISWFHPWFAAEDPELAWVLANVVAPALGDRPIGLRAAIDVLTLDDLLDMGGAERQAFQAENEAGTLVHPAQAAVAQRIVDEAVAIGAWLRSHSGVRGVRVVSVSRPGAKAPVPAVRVSFYGDGEDGSAVFECWERELPKPSVGQAWARVKT